MATSLGTHSTWYCLHENANPAGNFGGMKRHGPQKFSWKAGGKSALVELWVMNPVRAAGMFDASASGSMDIQVEEREAWLEGFTGTPRDRPRDLPLS